MCQTLCEVMPFGWWWKIFLSGAQVDEYLHHISWPFWECPTAYHDYKAEDPLVVWAQRNLTGMLLSHHHSVFCHHYQNPILMKPLAEVRKQVLSNPQKALVSKLVGCYRLFAGLYDSSHILSNCSTCNSLPILWYLTLLGSDEYSVTSQSVRHFVSKRFGYYWANLPEWSCSTGKTKSQFLPQTMLPFSRVKRLNFRGSRYLLYWGCGWRRIKSPISTVWTVLSLNVRQTHRLPAFSAFII